MISIYSSILLKQRLQRISVDIRGDTHMTSYLRGVCVRVWRKCDVIGRRSLGG